MITETQVRTYLFISMVNMESALFLIVHIQYIIEIITLIPIYTYIYIGTYHTHTHIYIYIYIYICVCVSICMCSK